LNKPLAAGGVYGNIQETAKSLGAQGKAAEKSGSQVGAARGKGKIRR
jgi:hypothetical protein